MRSIQKINQWIDSIINEYGDNISDGSLRTLNFIRLEANKMEDALIKNEFNEEKLACRESGHSYEWNSDIQMDVCSKCGKQR